MPFTSNYKGTLDITRDMTRQYKGMQEELLNRINQLEGAIQVANIIWIEKLRRKNITPQGFVGVRLIWTFIARPSGDTPVDLLVHGSVRGRYFVAQAYR